MSASLVQNKKLCDSEEEVTQLLIMETRKETQTSTMGI
jgi:hypothetical protein